MDASLAIQLLAMEQEGLCRQGLALLPEQQDVEKPPLVQRLPVPPGISLPPRQAKHPVLWPDRESPAAACRAPMAPAQRHAKRRNLRAGKIGMFSSLSCRPF